MILTISVPHSSETVFIQGGEGSLLGAFSQNGERGVEGSGGVALFSLHTLSACVCVCVRRVGGGVRR